MVFDPAARVPRDPAIAFDPGETSFEMCSIIVHLHPNRYPYSLILPYPKQPTCAGALCPGFGKEGLEGFREFIVHVKGRLIVHL